MTSISQLQSSTTSYINRHYTRQTSDTALNELSNDEHKSRKTETSSNDEYGYGGISIDPSMLQSMMQGQVMGPMPQEEGTGSESDLESRISAMDTDGDGMVTQQEFVAARPDDVSEEMATNLWSQFDTESAGTLSTDDLKTAMAGSRPPPPPPPLDSESETEEDTYSSTTSSSGSSLQSILSDLLNRTSQTSEASSDDPVTAMDTNGDGIVTKEEFLAARPDDVSEAMAENLWNSFDTERAGSLSASDLQTAMAENRPNSSDGVGDMKETAYQNLLKQLSEEDSTTSTSESTDSSTTSTKTESLQALLEAIQAYGSAAGYESARSVLYSLSSLA